MKTSILRKLKNLLLKILHFDSTRNTSGYYEMDDNVKIEQIITISHVKEENNHDINSSKSRESGKRKR